VKMRRLIDVVKNWLSPQKGMDAEEAESFLRSLDNENRFFVNNGPAVKDLYELISVLRDIPKDQFEFHVNDDKNDFSEWIHHAIGDTTLADEIRDTRNKYSMVLKVAERYSDLKHIAEKNGSRIK
jgi:hypothetical protein